MLARGKVEQRRHRGGRCHPHPVGKEVDHRGRFLAQLERRGCGDDPPGTLPDRDQAHDEQPHQQASGGGREVVPDLGARGGVPD